MKRHESPHDMQTFKRSTRLCCDDEVETHGNTNYLTFQDIHRQHRGIVDSQRTAPTYQNTLRNCQALRTSTPCPGKTNSLSHSRVLSRICIDSIAPSGIHSGQLQHIRTCFATAKYFELCSTAAAAGLRAVFSFAPPMSPSRPLQVVVFINMFAKKIEN